MGKTYGGAVLKAHHQYSPADVNTISDKASPKCSSSLPCCFYCSEAFCYQISAGALHSSICGKICFLIEEFLPVYLTFPTFAWLWKLIDPQHSLA